MKQQRMTATTVANIKASNNSGFYPARDGFDQVYGFMVWVSKGEGIRSVVCGSRAPIAYPTKELARRAVKRINPSLEPTDI
jgi:hypothetical protein